MKILFTGGLLIMMLLLFGACGSNSNERSVNVEDLEKAAAEDRQNAPPPPVRSALTATELMELAGCKDLACIQLYMKDRSSDFVHAKKGEFATLYRSVVADTSGKQLVMPMSTLYIATDPGATWRMAHTVHTEALSKALMEEFIAAKFVLADSSYNRYTKSSYYHYTSNLYPNLEMYHTKTFNPWTVKGLYVKVTWPCFVFEVYEE